MRLIEYAGLLGKKQKKISPPGSRSTNPVAKTLFWGLRQWEEEPVNPEKVSHLATLLRALLTMPTLPAPKPVRLGQADDESVHRFGGMPFNGGGKKNTSRKGQGERQSLV